MSAPCCRDDHIILVNIRDQNPAGWATIHPELGLLASLAFMTETLCLQQVHHHLPCRMLAFNERLGQEDVQMRLIQVKATQPDAITKEVIRQHVIRQVFKKQFSRLVENLEGLLIEHARVVVFEHAVQAFRRDHQVLHASADKLRAFDQAAGGLRVQDQARIMAEAGERAYFLLCWIRRMAAWVTGPCVSNCCCRASEKTLRTSK